MAARNKINSLNLIGFVKRFPKGYAPQRNVTSCSRLRKRPQTNEPDYSKFLSKDSAIYMVRESNALNRNFKNQRGQEVEQAQVQLRKCNKILKEHYLQRREQGQKTLIKTKFAQIEQTPTLSNKLKAIMALNVCTKPIETTSIDYLKQCRGFECKRQAIDYKQQNGARLNRWRMKVPHQKLKNLIDLESDETNMPSIRKKQRRVQPPKVKASKIVPPKTSIKPDKLLGRNQTKPKCNNMWQIGARCIPRLN